MSEAGGGRGIGGAGDRGGSDGMLRVSLVSPGAVLLNADASSVKVPAYDGLIGILPRHAPLMALLGRGVLTVATPDGDRRFNIGGGFVQVLSNTVRVVAEEAAPLT